MSARAATHINCTDVQSFDEYCDDMATEGEWGSAVELQALSLALRVNIVVHQLDNPRWEMVKCVGSLSFFSLISLTRDSFPATQKTIHLSYHNGDHYSSVRPLEGALLPSVASAPGGVADRSAYGGSSHHDGEDSGDDSDDEAVAAAVAASRRSPVAPRAPVSAVSEEVQLVMAATDCSDVEMVKQTLVENLYDVQVRSIALFLCPPPILMPPLHQGGHRLHHSSAADRGRPLLGSTC